MDTYPGPYITKYASIRRCYALLSWYKMFRISDFEQSNVIVKVPLRTWLITRGYGLYKGMDVTCPGAPLS
jgi:hypothetical protein